jgi:hypothetical protein
MCLLVFTHQEITHVLNDVVAALGNIPALASLLAGVDVALNQVLLGLEILIAGVLTLVASLLIGVAGLLAALAFGLTLATLVL